jgi:hypothetical protein
MMNRVKLIRLVALLGLTPVLASCDLMGYSAGDLYDSCSVSHIAESARTSEQKIAFSRREKFSSRVFYSNGFIYVYVGYKKDPKIEDLKNYCPLGGLWFWTAPYVYLLETWDSYGMSFVERNFISAESAALAVFRKKFPLCPVKRAYAGVPMVEKF